MAFGYCSSCGARFAANARFCGTCGASLASPKRAISSHSAEAARLANVTRYGAPESSTAALGGTQMGLPEADHGERPVVRVPVSLGAATESLRAQFGGERPSGTFGPPSRAPASRPTSTRPDPWMDSAEVTGSGFAAAIAKSESLVPLMAMLVGMIVFVLGVGLALYAFGQHQRGSVPAASDGVIPRPPVAPGAGPSVRAPVVAPPLVTVSGRIYNVTTDGSDTVLQVLARGADGGAIPYWVSISSESNVDTAAFAGGRWVRVEGTDGGQRRVVTASGDLRSVQWLRATAVTPLESSPVIRDL